MKSRFSLFAFLLIITAHWSFVSGQCTPRAKAVESGLELTFKGEGGTNSSAVVWNPVAQVYYSVIAGNSTFPLETFDSNGNSIATAQAGEDMRGLWWNPSTGKLEGNSYTDGAWVKFNVTADGQADGEYQIIFSETKQPAPQSIGVLNTSKQLVVFYDNGLLFTFSRASGKPGKQIKLTGIPTSLDYINSNTVIYTGCKGYEYGILDFESAQIHLFSAKGKFAATVSLPTGAIVNYSFWLSYANEQLFLYNADNRTWTAYKIFE